jgi:hypothetical protein
LLLLCAIDLFVLFVFIFAGDKIIPENGVWGYAYPGIGWD